MRAGEENISNGPKLHPHQKPVALLSYIIDYAKLAPRSRILDAYAGSCSVAIAALRKGHDSVSIEIDEQWCEVAAIRFDKELKLAPASPVAVGARACRRNLLLAEE